MARRNRAYIDSCVFITAWRGKEPERALARRFLLDGSRDFVGSRLVALETIPKATYQKREAEIAFYNGLLNAVTEWVPIDDTLVQVAIEIGCIHDVAGIDALHVAAAVIADVDEFITIEEPTKPMYRIAAIGPKHLSSL